jgi:hypothetical protein
MVTVIATLQKIYNTTKILYKYNYINYVKKPAQGYKLVLFNFGALHQPVISCTINFGALHRLSCTIDFGALHRPGINYSYICVTHQGSIIAILSTCMLSM